MACPNTIKYQTEAAAGEHPLTSAERGASHRSRSHRESHRKARSSAAVRLREGSWGELLGVSIPERGGHTPSESVQGWPHPKPECSVTATTQISVFSHGHTPSKSQGWWGSVEDRALVP